MEYDKVIKRQSTIIAASIIGMCLIIMGTSYALFFKVNKSSNNQVVETGTLTTEYAQGSTMTTEMLPMSDTDGLAQSGYSFSVTNTGTLNMNYEITLSNDPDATLTNALDQQYIKVSLDNATPVLMSSLTKTSDTASLTDQNEIKYLMASNLILYPAGTDGSSASHNIKIWITEDAPESIIDKTVNIVINVNGEVTETETLTHKILTVAGGTTSIQAKTTPTYANNATTDEGMFATTDDYGTSYYYRGAVTQNNVLFGGYCWKVIRINGNGTTRMIYNGTPSNGTCVSTSLNNQIGTSDFNSNSGDNAYAGYMYGTAGSSTYEETHANTNSSTIKTTLETWYNTHLASYSSKISDTLFCNDRNLSLGTGIGTTYTEYGAYNRRFNIHIPVLTCQNQNDRFTVSDGTIGNAKLTYSIGLITMDEVGLAGASMSSLTANSSYYLYTSNYYWTMSSSGFDTESNSEGIFDVNSNGIINIDLVNNALDVRPVINLNSDVTFASGDGTSATPYTIS